MEDPLISVVIPAPADVPALRPCVEKVLKQDYENREVIVVCGAGREEEVSLPGEEGRIRKIRQEEPGGVPELLNLGLRAAKGDIRIILSPECLPAGDGWLSAMAEPFEDDEVGAVISQCQVEEKTELSILQRLMQAVDRVERSAEGDEPVPQELLSGRCDAFRAEMLEELGYFEENTSAPPAHAVDLSVRIADAGYSMLLTPDALVTCREAPGVWGDEGTLQTGLALGRCDAQLGSRHGVEWLNARLFATALGSLLLLPVGAYSLPIGTMMALALIVWGWFLSVRLPPLPWHWPVGVVNLGVYVAGVLYLRGDWAPWLFGWQMHPALIRHWCLLAAGTATYAAVVFCSAADTAVRSASRTGSMSRFPGVFLAAIPWWLAAGIGYMGGVLAPGASK
ncbi:MAG: glycosyltransferase family 2 protein [Planctomycetota bacterium]